MPARRLASPRLLPAVTAARGIHMSPWLGDDAKKGGKVQFDNPFAAFEGKSNMDLFIGYVVLKACSWKWLVKNSDTLLKTSYKVFGAPLTNFVLRHSFFAHFCAGEDEISIKPTVHKLKARGIGGILDFAAEADVPTGGAPAGAPGQTHYSASDEAQCDSNVAIFRTCIQAVHNVTPEGFAAIKITALGLPVLLERMSTAIVEIRRLFALADTAGTGSLSSEDFARTLGKIFPEATPADLSRVFSSLDGDKDGRVDYVEWTSTLHMRELWELMNKAPAGSPMRDAMLSPEEIRLMENMMRRVEALAEYAKEQEVRLMIDAEQTYFQPAIDAIVLNLQAKYNKEFPTIFNTYQCYLKDSLKRVTEDLERSKRMGYWFAAKLVRGAYMVQERERAEQLGYPSPIHDTLENTHANYNKAIGLVLSAPKRNLLVASHNQTSVEYTVAKMDELNICRDKGGVYFGQLLGMADRLTYPLAAQGYKAYKYVPYGPIKEVIPYLLRRAQENSDILGGAAKERDMMLAALKKRLL